MQACVNVHAGAADASIPLPSFTMRLLRAHTLACKACSSCVAAHAGAHTLDAKATAAHCMRSLTTPIDRLAPETSRALSGTCRRELSLSAPMWWCLKRLRLSSVTSRSWLWGAGRSRT